MKTFTKVTSQCSQKPSSYSPYDSAQIRAQGELDSAETIRDRGSSCLLSNLFLTHEHIECRQHISSFSNSDLGVFYSVSMFWKPEACYQVNPSLTLSSTMSSKTSVSGLFSCRECGSGKGWTSLRTWRPYDKNYHCRELQARSEPDFPFLKSLCIFLVLQSLFKFHFFLHACCLDLH